MKAPPKRRGQAVPDLESPLLFISRRESRSQWGELLKLVAANPVIGTIRGLRYAQFWLEISPSMTEGAKHSRLKMLIPRRFPSGTDAWHVLSSVIRVMLRPAGGISLDFVSTTA